jgi:hypothetical protein
LEPTPLDKIKQKRQEQAAAQADAHKTQSIIDAVKSSGGDTKDSITSAMHDLLLATLVAKDPRMADVSSQVAQLLQDIAKASDNFKNSGLDVIPKTFSGLIEALKALPDEIAKRDTSSELIPYLENINKSVNSARVVVNPNVRAAVDLSPLTNILGRVEQAISENKVNIPETDFSNLELAIKAVEDKIANLKFPVANYILPFKDPTTGKATQVILDSSGNVPITGSFSPEKASSDSISRVSTSTTSATILSSNSSRKKAVVVNEAAANLYVKYGTTASATSYSYLLEPNDILEETVFTGRIDAILASGTGNAQVSEM